MLSVKKVVALLGLIGIIALSTAVYLFLDLKDNSSSNLQDNEQAYSVSRNNLVKSISISGNLEYGSIDQIRLSSGTVGAVYVEEGDRVSKGDLLVSLDEQSIALLRKHLAQVEIDLIEAKSSYSDFIGVGQELRAAEAASSVQEAFEQLEEAQQALADLISETEQELRAAEAASSVQEAFEQLEEAQQALADLIDPPLVEMADSENMVIIGEKNLAAAESLLQDLGSSYPSTLIDVDLRLATARDKLASEQEAYDKVSDPIGSGHLEDLYSKLLSASSSLATIKVDRDINASQMPSQLAQLANAVRKAETEYLQTLRGWFGVDNPSLLSMSPTEIYDMWGVDLDSLFSRSNRASDINKFIRGYVASNYEADPYNDAAILTWLAFYPGNVTGTCESTLPSSTIRCVDHELQSAWETLSLDRESMEETKLQSTKSFETNEEKVRKAEESYKSILEEYEEISGSPGSDLTDARLKLDIAQADVLSAERISSLAHINVESDRKAQENKVKIARSELGFAQSRLAEITNGASEEEKEAAEGKVTVANWKLINARKELEDTSGPSEEAIEAAEGIVTLATWRLVNARNELEDTGSPSKEAIEAAEGIVTLATWGLVNAREELNSTGELDELQKTLLQAETARVEGLLADATTSLEEVLIIAPFDGLVMSLNVQTGDEVKTAAPPALELAKANVFDLRGAVDEIDVLFVRTGSKAEVVVDADLTAPELGTVESVSLTSSSQQGVVTYPLTIRLDSDPSIELREGMSAVAQIVVDEALGEILVPLDSIHGTMQQPYVKVYENGSVSENPVSLGINDEYWVVVRSGLVEGQSIVIVTEPVQVQSGFSSFRGGPSGGFMRPQGGGR